MNSLYFRKIMFLAAGILISAYISIAQTVVINKVPPIGEGGVAEGRVVWKQLTSENAEQYAVIAILRADFGNDYVKPSYVNYLSDIDALGYFSINITTGGSDHIQPNYNFYFVKRSIFDGVDGSSIKSWNMEGRYLGYPTVINRNDYWTTRLQSPTPNIRPGFVPAGTTITLTQPIENDAEILFTLDGSDPFTSSTAHIYNEESFVVPSTGALLVKAVVTKKSGEAKLEYSYPSNMTWIANEASDSNCKLFGLNVSLALNGETFGHQLSKETTQIRMSPIPQLTQWIRTFGTLNNGLEYINDIAKDMSLRTMIGVYISTDISKNNAQLQGLRNILQTTSVPDLLAVGNECNNSILATYVPQKIMSNYIDSVHKIVQGMGLLIPIGTVDIGNTSYNQLISHKLDFRGVNLYPGTHDKTPSDQMFSELKNSWNNELSISPSMMVLLTETGTPYAGGTSAGGMQVASIPKAVAYFQNIVNWTKEESIPCFYFEAYDEPTKGPGIEQYFGLMDDNLAIHPFYSDILCPITTNTVDAKSDVRIFSNPTNHVLVFETESKIDIYNAQGMLLQQIIGKQINISAYPNGTYLLKVNDKMYKIIKQ